MSRVVGDEAADERPIVELPPGLTDANAWSGPKGRTASLRVAVVGVAKGRIDQLS